MTDSALTSRYVKTELAIPNQSVYLPYVHPLVGPLLPDIFHAVGEIDQIDWVSRSSGGHSAYVHFSVCYDTSVTEQLLCAMDEDISFRLPFTGAGNQPYYLIVRKNKNPVPRYSGPYSIDYFAEAIDVLSSAYVYGLLQQTSGNARFIDDILKPKHIRFDEDDVPHVCEYYVALPTDKRRLPPYFGNKNIHQLACEYQWWLDFCKRGDLPHHPFGTAPPANLCKSIPHLHTESTT